jgi:threonine dehydratase
LTTIQAPPDFDSILAAADRIKDVAVRTPLVESGALSKRFGREVYLKLECFQPIRVFKIRGAYNKLSQLNSDRVVAASSGNHGMAVAYSAKLLHKKCTVVVPETAVQEKVSAIAEYGAEVVKFGRFSHEREIKAREIAAKSGAVFVPPFNDTDVIAGQGTCGLEITEQLHEATSIIVPVGGGGLISGISIAVKSVNPGCRVYSVEAEGAPKLSASLKAGKLVKIESPHSIADGLIPSSLGELTFDICREHVDGAYEVTDEQILMAMSLLAREAHIFAEPSGAAPVAALLAGRELGRLGKKVVCVISGGNVSLQLLRRAIGD